MSDHLDIVWTNQFKKDYKLALKRHLDIQLLDDIIRKLSKGEQLPEKKQRPCFDRRLDWPPRVPHTTQLAISISNRSGFTYLNTFQDRYP